MSDLKWSITIGKKPRGMWRPLITIKFWNQGNTSNPLNIKGEIRLPYFRWDCSTQNEKWKNCKEAAESTISALKFYESASYKNMKFKNHCIGCGDCKFFGWDLGSFDVFKDIKIEACLEWRPGLPDYTDYIYFLQEAVCLPAIAEYERRIQEAMESVEMEEYTISSDSYEFQKREEEIKVKPIRKLKVA